MFDPPLSIESGTEFRQIIGVDKRYTVTHWKWFTYRLQNMCVFYNDIILISIKDKNILIQFRLNSPLELSPVVNNDASGVNRYWAGVR